MVILPFPNYRQSFRYDCGVKAMHAILAYYGNDIGERKIFELAKTSRNGTSVEAIKRVFKHYGLKITAKEMTVEDVRLYILKKNPVLLLLQAWPLKKKVDYSSNWTDGHWAVAIGFDEHRIFFEDPLSIKRTYLTRSELITRWHDFVSNKKIYHYFGIAVYGKKPSFDPNDFEHMD